MKEITEKDKLDIVELYKSQSIGSIAKKYNIGDRRVRKILVDFGVEIYDSHLKTKSSDDYIEKNNARFPVVSGHHYIAVSKFDQKEFEDYLNKSGCLTNYIKSKLGIEVPSLFKRKKYFHENNKQWFENWFDIILVKDVDGPKKICPYCGWETSDVDNKSGMFMTHLLKEHGKTVEDYLLEYPEDCNYFKKQVAIIDKRERLKEKENFVICPLCGEKMEKITYWHLKNKHSIDYDVFRKKYPNAKVISDTMLLQTLSAQTQINLTTPKKRFVSKYEKEIQNLLNTYSIDFETNRQILIGKELDILIKDKKIAIEFDGLKWHTEWFGKKNHNYHLEKTIMCNNKGYGLIHVFEDEYVNKKELVSKKILHILGVCDGAKIMGRKCIVKEILKYDAKEFLEKYHIQGYVSSSIYLGAFYNDELVAVMSFKNGNLKNNSWELTRFASNYDYICQGIGGKLFKYFIKKYKPYKIISFADRRWTININDNLYTKLGFTIESINRPDYKYYNENTFRYKRLHKLYFNKQKLHKKYGFPLTMTETEMAKELGYDRIWDCGLVKYVWKNNESVINE